MSWKEEDRREFTQAIVEEAERLNRLVGDLLDLSRIEAGSIQPGPGIPAAAGWGWQWQEGW